MTSSYHIFVLKGIYFSPLPRPTILLTVFTPITFNTWHKQRSPSFRYIMQSLAEFSYCRISVKHLPTCNKLMKQSKSRYNGCRLQSNWYIESYAQRRNLGHSVSCKVGCMKLVQQNINECLRALMRVLNEEITLQGKLVAINGISTHRFSRNPGEFPTCCSSWYTRVIYTSAYRINKRTFLVLRISLLVSSYMFPLNCHHHGARTILLQLTAIKQSTMLKYIKRTD
jgi:hypothetical protein